MTHEWNAISETYNRDIILWNLHIFYQMFLSQQVKWKVIISGKDAKNELPDEFPNVKRESQNYMEL